MAGAGLVSKAAPIEPSAVLIEGQGRPPRFYMPQLDLMRLFAFLSVFLLHCLPSVDVGSHTGSAKTWALLAKTFELSGRNGVGLFFLLSSYLITELLTRERELTGGIHLKMFYIRRILRIWPLYYSMVLIGLLLQPLRPENHLSLPGILSFLLFLNNWQVVLHGYTWTAIAPLWTVSAEEQFYLFWPFAMRKFSRQTMLALSAVAIVAFPLIAYRTASLPWRTDTTELVATLLFFPLGGILSMMFKRGKEPLLTLKAAGIFMSGFLCWLAGGVVAQPTGDLLAAPMTALVGKTIVGGGTCLIFVAFLRSNSSIWPRWMVYLGKISFGLYVFHLPVHEGVVFLARLAGLGLRTGNNHTIVNMIISAGVILPVTLLCTIAVAALSYRFLEKPFLVMKDRFALVHSRDI
jgi:peptidoglycan/LPS O-acetylase OafA/YrhL